MYDSSLALFGDTFTRVSHAIKAVESGLGVLVVDNEDRENEGDFIFSADTLTDDQMDIMKRHGSGTMCLCLSEERNKQLNSSKIIPSTISIKTTAEKKYFIPKASQACSRFSFTRP
jgi:3,4-dihydroxy 2-butanone 4-phosphate synthase